MYRTVCMCRLSISSIFLDRQTYHILLTCLTCFATNGKPISSISIAMDYDGDVVTSRYTSLTNNYVNDTTYSNASMM